MSLRSFVTGAGKGRSTGRQRAEAARDIQRQVARLAKATGLTGSQVRDAAQAYHQAAQRQKANAPAGQPVHTPSFAEFVAGWRKGSERTTPKTEWAGMQVQQTEQSPPAYRSAASRGRWTTVGGIENYQGYATTFGREIEPRPVGRAALRQLRNLPDGFTVVIDFDNLPGNLKGLWEKEFRQPDLITIYAMANSGPLEAASSFIHEARHAVLNSRGVDQETKTAEYMARAREFLLKKGRRPDASERLEIQTVVKKR